MSNGFTPIEVKPVTIKKSDNEANIISFQSNVTVTSENNRIAGGAFKRDSYRLSMKLINNELYTRLDYPATNDGFARSVINSPRELTVFDRGTGEIKYRSPIENLPDSDTAAPTLFGRLPIGTIRETYSKLSYKIVEDAASKVMVIEIPESELMDKTIAGDRLTGQKIFFDTALSTVCGSEYTIVDERNVRIKTEETLTYQVIDGIPVKTGRISVVSYDFPERVDTSDRILPQIDDYASIPEISEAELKAMVESGTRVFYEDPIIGDVGDRDYSIRTVEEYSDIELNDLSDALFRVQL